MRLRTALLASLLLGACGDRRSVQPVDVPVVAKAEAPATELALKVSDSVAVWFTNSRPDTAADGQTCVERLMEIRAGSRAVPVPLLYTGETPTIRNDSTIQVHIWRHCVPADLYRVHLRTGQPTRAGT